MLSIRGRQFKKDFGFSIQQFYSKSNWSTMHFLFDFNLKLHSGLKAGGCAIKFIIQKPPISKKILADSLFQFIKFQWQNFKCSFVQLLNNTVDFSASDFEAAVQLQIEVKQKKLGRSVTFGVKSFEKHPQTKNFFEMTIPDAYLFLLSHYTT